MERDYSTEYEVMVGRAILADPATEDGRRERERQLARVACKSAASTLIFCPMCGPVMDQRKTVVLQVFNFKTGYVGKIHASCAGCFERELRPAVQESLDACENGTECHIETWSGLEILRKVQS